MHICQTTFQHTKCGEVYKPNYEKHLRMIYGTSKKYSCQGSLETKGNKKKH
jgi:sulfur relay (sulfurtransferase) DsrF/TusC family protein